MCFPREKNSRARGGVKHVQSAHRNELRERKRIASVTSHQYADEVGILGNGWNKMAGAKQDVQQFFPCLKGYRVRNPSRQLITISRIERCIFRTGWWTSRLNHFCFCSPAGVPGPTVGAGASSFALSALFFGWLVRRRRQTSLSCLLECSADVRAKRRPSPCHN